MSKHPVLGLKPQLRLEWRGQDDLNETEQPDHSASLGDSITSSTQIRFSVHTDSWNNEQVHGGNVRRMVTQEGSPSLAGWPPSFDHVFGDARLRDLKPQLEQFAVDAGRAPKRIFGAHPPDQYAQLRVDLRSPSLWARLPTPVAAKAGPVPTHERLGPDDCENLQD